MALVSSNDEAGRNTPHTSLDDASERLLTALRNGELNATAQHFKEKAREPVAADQWTEKTLHRDDMEHAVEESGPPDRPTVYSHIRFDRDEVMSVFPRTRGRPRGKDDAKLIGLALRTYNSLYDEYVAQGRIGRRPWLTTAANKIAGEIRPDGGNEAEALAKRIRRRFSDAYPGHEAIRPRQVDRMPKVKGRKPTR